MGPGGGWGDVAYTVDAGATHGRYSVENFDGSKRHWSDVETVVGETAFLVVKAELAPGVDTFTLYMNPIPGLDEPASGIVKPDNDMTDALLLVIDAKGSYSLDEIRWGETFADVTPAPPLATTELIGSGEQWDFFRGTAEPSPFPELAWTTGRFDDTAWETAQEGFGYGSDVETGIIYYRGHLKLSNGGSPNHKAVDAAIAASLAGDDDSQDALFD